MIETLIFCLFLAYCSGVAIAAMSISLWNTANNFPEHLNLKESFWSWLAVIKMIKLIFNGNNHN